MEYPHLKKHSWGQQMPARGYFCCGTGNVTAEYIANQADSPEDDFKVDG
jgi:hypothetical protein